MQVLELMRFLSQQDPHATVVIWHCDRNPDDDDVPYDDDLMEYEIAECTVSPAGDVIISTDPIDEG